MKIDFSKIVFRNIEDATLNQVYDFYLTRGGKILADIQVLEFKDGFGSQAKIRSEHAKAGCVSSGRKFESAEEAINDVIAQIAIALLDDPTI